MSALVVDSFEFCRSAGRASGTTPVADFDRLSGDLADSLGELHWSFLGGQHVDGHPQLEMDVAGEVKLVCQRCMVAFDYPLQSHSLLVLAADEAQAEALEQRLDDDSVDVIVGSSTMDFMLLVEDEALLSLPQSPRHDICPGSVPETREDKAESPFAVLKRLKT